MADFSRVAYETLLYTLTERYPGVSAATARLYTNSATTAFVRGSVHFHTGITFRAPNLPTLIADCEALGSQPQP